MKSDEHRGRKTNSTTSVAKATAPMKRTASGLREVLFEEIDQLRNGTSDPGRARSVALLANSVLESIQVEIEYHKYVNYATKGKGAVPRLGSLELADPLKT